MLMFKVCFTQYKHTLNISIKDPIILILNVIDHGYFIVVIILLLLIIMNLCDCCYVIVCYFIVINIL